MIFERNIFKKCKSNELYKEYMNGLEDETMKDYNLLLTSSIFKEEYKDDKQEKEFILAYLESARIINVELYSKQNKGNGINKIFYNYSLVLPVIYLCRHALELTIKRVIRKLGGNIKFNHSLLKQWNSLREYLRKYNISEKDKKLLEDMGMFIGDFELLDDNGSRLRYPKQQDNSDSQNKFFWVNTKTIVRQTELFISQLEWINLENM